MGSASRIALGEARQVLDGLAKAEGLGQGLLQASAILGSEPQLLAMVSDPAAETSAKTKIVDTIFAKFSKGTRDALHAVAKGRWSNAKELVAGVEELGIRAEAKSNPDLDEELLAVDKIIASDHELELTLGSKLIDGAAKSDLVAKLFAGKVSEPTLAILTHIVGNARGRRIGRSLQDFAKVVADQAGKTLATVTVASALDPKNIKQLEKTLASQAGRPVKVTTVVDPRVIGGMSIRMGDSVIDGTVKSRLDNLRLKLAL